MEIEAALATADQLRSIDGLPDELLSMVLETDFLPGADNALSEVEQRRGLERYLMAWSLILLWFKDSVLCDFVLTNWVVVETQNQIYHDS